MQDAAARVSEPEELFPAHLPLAEVQAGLRGGTLVQGKFQMSRDNCLEAFVNMFDSNEQVTISR